MPVERLPVGREPSRHLPQQVAGQMTHLDPGQDQKTRLVSNATQVAAPHFGGPADELIPPSQMPRRRRPGILPRGDHFPMAPIGVSTKGKRSLTVAARIGIAAASIRAATVRERLPSWQASRETILFTRPLWQSAPECPESQTQIGRA